MALSGHSDTRRDVRFLPGKRTSMLLGQRPFHQPGHRRSAGGWTVTDSDEGAGDAEATLQATNGLSTSH